MQLELPGIGGEPTDPADRAFQVLAMYWQYRAGQLGPKGQLSVRDDLVSISCLYLAVENGKRISRQSKQLAEQILHIGEKLDVPWLDSLSWKLCLAVTKRNPQHESGAECAMSNLNHHKSGIRSHVHHLVWVAAPLLDGPMARERLIACVFERLSPETAVGLFVKLTGGMEDLPSSMDMSTVERLHRIRSADSRFHDLEDYKTNGLRAYMERVAEYKTRSIVELQAHFHKKEAQARNLILQVMAGSVELTVPTEDELKDW